MTPFVIVNGELMEGDKPVITLDNRAFHYGDGIFETIRIVKGSPSFLDAHWARLMEGLKVLRIQQPRGLDRSSLERYLLQLVARCGMPNARARLTIFRDSPGYYRPQHHTGGFTIELNAIPNEVYTLNEHGLMVDIYPEMRKAVNMLAVHKTLGCQLYVMANLWCMERGLDDCLLQNDRGNIIESSGGNLFIVSNGVLYTPSLADGCLGGIMRMQIINLAIENGIKVYECSLNPQNLLAADELFFTNASRGLQWVGSYRTKRYTHRLAGSLVTMLVNKVLTRS
ncbi:MAG: aminotransferase class IV [Flavobacteriales bacterium]|nr:aminotransferase class IV [Flavobacteriales bacterium]MBL0035554.1 aminotransferase class IV [Flavobacteriales bacterium]